MIPSAGMPRKKGPGRPRRAGRLAKRVVGIRVTPSELARLERAAGYMPLAVWARQILFAAADKVLDD